LQGINAVQNNPTSRKAIFFSACFFCYFSFAKKSKEALNNGKTIPLSQKNCREVVLDSLGKIN